MPGDLNKLQPVTATMEEGMTIDMLLISQPSLLVDVNTLSRIPNGESDLKNIKTNFEQHPELLFSNWDMNRINDKIKNLDQWLKNPVNATQVRNFASSTGQPVDQVVSGITGEKLFWKMVELQQSYVKVIDTRFPKQPKINFQKQAPGKNILINNQFVQNNSKEMDLLFLDLNKHDSEFAKDIANFKNEPNQDIASLYSDIMNMSNMSSDVMFNDNDIDRNNGTLYDRKVNDIYKKMTKIINEHPNELNDKNSSVYKIAQYKAKHFDQGSLQIKDLEDAQIIDATGRYQTNIHDFSESNTVSYDGDKMEQCVENARFRGNYRLSGVGKNVVMVDRSKEPLFPHEPHFSDIKQGNVGNCYFLAYMSSLAKSNPQAIKDMIKDNNDGTVTCRFYNGIAPVYVTVNKTVAHVQSYDGQKTWPSNGENNPLWLDMIEKAYKMSGLRDQYNRNLNKNTKEYRSFLNNYRKSCNGYAMNDQEVEQAIFRQCYGNNVPFNNDLYDKILLSSNIGFSSGNSGEIAARLTGTSMPSKLISLKNPDQFFSPYSRKMAAPPLSAKDGNMKPKELNDVVYEMKYLVAKDLWKNKESRKYALEGGMEDAEYVRYSAVTVEDVTDGLKNVVNNYGNYLMQKFPNISYDQLKNLAKTYSDSVVDYHMNNAGANALGFRTEGVYSKFTNNLYNDIKEHIKQDGFVQVGMAGHAFSVLGAEERDGKKYITLRNPWRRTGLDGNQNAQSVSYGNNQFKGVFEMELNEFVSKAVDYSAIHSKQIEISELRNRVANQYIDTFAKKFKLDSPEEFKNKCKTDPEIFDIIKHCPEVNDVVKACKKYPTYAVDYQLYDGLTDNQFEEFSHISQESMQNLYNAVQNPVKQKPAAQNAQLQPKPQNVQPNVEPKPLQLNPQDYQKLVDSTIDTIIDNDLYLRESVLGRSYEKEQYSYKEAMDGIAYLETQSLIAKERPEDKEQAAKFIEEKYLNNPEKYNLFKNFLNKEQAAVLPSINGKLVIDHMLKRRDNHIAKYHNVKTEEQVMNNIVLNCSELLTKVNGLPSLAYGVNDFRASKAFFESNPNQILNNLNKEQKAVHIAALDQFLKNPANKDRLTKNAGRHKLRQQALSRITAEKLFDKIARMQSDYIEEMNREIAADDKRIAEQNPKPVPNKAPQQPNPAPKNVVQNPNPVPKNVEQNPNPAPKNDPPKPAPKSDTRKVLGNQLKEKMDALSVKVKNDKMYAPIQDILNTLMTPSESGKYNSKDLVGIQKAYELIEEYQNNLEAKAQKGYDFDDDIAHLSGIMVTLDYMELDAKEVLSTLENKPAWDMTFVGFAQELKDGDKDKQIRPKTPQEALAIVKNRTASELRNMSNVEDGAMKRAYANIIICDNYTKALQNGQAVDLQCFDKDVEALLADKTAMNHIVDFVEDEHKLFTNAKPESAAAKLEVLSESLGTGYNSFYRDVQRYKQAQEQQKVMNNLSS